MKQRLYDWLHLQRHVNYIFFSCTFLYLVLLSIALIVQSSETVGISLYFSLYAILQAFVETLCFLMIGLWIRSFLPKWLYMLYTGFLFLCLLAHLVNYILIRLIDTTISYVRDLFFSEDFAHFVTSIRALDMNPMFLAFMALVIFSIPWLGALVYQLGAYFSHKKKKTISIAQCLKVFVSASLILIAFDLWIHPDLAFSQFLKFEKFLPVSNTFYAPKGPILHFSSPFKKLPLEEEVSKKIAVFSPTTTSKPNIYLFVVETFRADHVNEEIAPHLMAFKQENISFDRAISNANSSHKAWYSIFHANFPHHWKEAKENWQKGSVPIQLLKKLGYQTHVIASTDIKYFHMKELLFGQEKGLIDEYIDLADDLDLSPDERDLKAITLLEEKIQSHKQANLFIVFLDSPHSNYNWPDEASSFAPFVDEINYFELISTCSSLEQVKNRYKNAIHYIDTLFGRFIKALQEENLYENAILAFTGDHGEEFFEEGAIFHATHLNEYQTHIPLFYKFPSSPAIPAASKKLATQIDIFPSILHYLTQEDLSGFFDGESIFYAKKWPYTFTAMHNGNATPFQFYLHNGKEHLEIRNTSFDVFENQEFEVISHSIEKDHRIFSKAFIEKHFPGAIERLTK